MFRLVFLLIFVVSLGACKQEDVAFNSVEQNPHSASSQTPTPDPVDPVDPVDPPPPSDDDDDPLPIQPPVVQVAKAPEDHLLGGQTELVYEIVPGDFPIESIECSVNGVVVDCHLDSAEIPLVDFPLGDNTVVVEVIDESGLVAKIEEDWKVSREIFRRTTDIQVEIEEQKADILFVVDNSISMHEEQQKVADRISNFFAKINKLNWRVGIITTDPYRKEPQTGQVDPYADGVLLRFPNGNYYLEASTPLGQAKKLFEETIFRPEQGNGHERGIRNTYRSIERYLSSDNSVENQRLKSFYRSDATLSVVVISDENETLVNGVGNPLTELHKSEGQNLVEFVKNAWSEKKKFQFNSIVVRTGDDRCKGPDESYGSAYELTSRLTGGVIEDICANDYTGALSKIGSGVANLQKVYDLSCQPQDKDDDGVLDVLVKTSGPSVPDFTINGLKIEFDTPLEEGSYQVVYYCY